MNQCEIDHCVTIATNESYLFETEEAWLVALSAAVYLRDYRDVVNSVSDGWSHWAAGTRPAAPLSRIVSHLRNPRYDRFRSTCDCLSRKEVEKAMRRIELFCIRKGFEVPTRLAVASQPPPRVLHPTPPQAVASREPENLNLFELLAS